MNTKLKNILK